MKENCMRSQLYRHLSTFCVALAFVSASGFIFTAPAFAADTYYCRVNQAGNDCDQHCDPHGASSCDKVIRSTGTGTAVFCSGCTN
jgi:hypothetical protein